MGRGHPISRFCHVNEKEKNGRTEVFCDLCKHNIIFNLGEKKLKRKILSDSGIHSHIIVYDKRHMDIIVNQHFSYKTKYGFIKYGITIEAYIIGAHVEQILHQLKRLLNNDNTIVKILVVE